MLTDHSVVQHQHSSAEILVPVDLHMSAGRGSACCCSTVLVLGLVSSLCRPGTWQHSLKLRSVWLSLGAERSLGVAVLHSDCTSAKRNCAHMHFSRAMCWTVFRLYSNILTELP